MTLLGREVPALPAEILFSDIEILVLRSWANRLDERVEFAIVTTLLEFRNQRSSGEGARGFDLIAV